ncbi:MAG: A/G-specific adenine glycosylase [Planctomycetota bacterium]|nr:A/G-specific adenine glycosylase [Planctomycetota bacterium]
MDELERIDGAWKTRFRRSLLRWYDRHGRDLPWRAAADPYRVWISEIMLQQTTVAAVKPYFERFVDRFPTVHALAEASEEDVLRLWEGLGYYSRARNLAKAAKRIVTDFNGRFPEDVESLRTLPGIGRYTAGAIVSFAFDRPAPIVEANTLRLYARLLGYDGDPRGTAGQRVLWAFAEQVLPKARPGRFNQALIDLGATVCTPKDPNCEACPAKGSCLAFANGTQDSIPRLAKRAKITRLLMAAVVVRNNGRVLVRQYADGERWAGLWDFARVDLGVDDKPQDPPPASVVKDVQSRIAALTGLNIEVSPSFVVLEHSVTRYRIRLLAFEGTTLEQTVSASVNSRWVEASSLDELPLSVTARQIAKRLL